jgi:hypothetical protein
MKALIFTLSFLLLLPAVSSCSSRKPVSSFAGDAAVVGGATALGWELSGKKPGVAIASGVVALGVKTLADHAADKQLQQAENEAYLRGVAQNAKQTYDAIQNSQKTSLDTTTTTEENAPKKIAVPITAPERTINGVKVNVSQEVIYITAQ